MRVRPCARSFRPPGSGLTPTGSLAADNRAHERRWFDLDQSYGGEWFAQGQFDAEGGALLKTLLDAVTEVPRPGDTRSASQRRADALVDLAAAQLRSRADPEVHGQRPHLTVTVNARALRSGADAEAAVLQGVGPIHPASARRIACDAVKTEVSVAPSADVENAWLSNVTTPVLPLSVGRGDAHHPGPYPHGALPARQRLPLPGLRSAPGVDRRASHHPLGGRRSDRVEDLVSLCRRHHRAVHEQGWRIRMDDAIPVVEAPP